MTDILTRLIRELTRNHAPGAEDKYICPTCGDWSTRRACLCSACVTDDIGNLVGHGLADRLLAAVIEYQQVCDAMAQERARRVRQ